MVSLGLKRLDHGSIWPMDSHLSRTIGLYKAVLSSCPLTFRIFRHESVTGLWSHTTLWEIHISSTSGFLEGTLKNLYLIFNIGSSSELFPLSHTMQRWATKHLSLKIAELVWGIFFPSPVLVASMAYHLPLECSICCSQL